jgi:hypothetical protein
MNRSVTLLPAKPRPRQAGRAEPEAGMSVQNSSPVTVTTDLVTSVPQSERTGVDELVELLRPPAWHADADCRGLPEVTWFPGIRESTARAEATCQERLVTSGCLGWALEHGPGMAGIWGGLSPHQRRWLVLATR